MAPQFTNNPIPSSVIEEGFYLTKIVAAQERCSRKDNAMIVMKLELPDKRTLGTQLAFTPKTGKWINAFCESAELEKPTDPNVQIELTASHCRGRYVYVQIKHQEDDYGEKYMPPSHLMASSVLKRLTSWLAAPAVDGGTGESGFERLKGSPAS